MREYQSRTMSAITISIFGMIGMLFFAIGVVTTSAAGSTPTPTPTPEVEPKFHYNDCVAVTRGFYRGCFGPVKEYHSKSDYNKEEYEILMTCRGEESGSHSFEASSLKQVSCKRNRNAN